MIDSTFPAQAYVGGRTLRGRLAIDPRQVIFIPDRVEGAAEVAVVTLPVSGLKLRRGGHNDESVFLSHPQNLNVSIYTRDWEILKHDVFRSDPEFRQALETIARKRAKVFPVFVALLALLALLVASGVLLLLQKDRVVRWVAEKIPRSWETQVGDRVYQQLKAEGRLNAPQQVSPDVQRMIDRLVAAARPGGFNFQFHIVDDKTWNAFAVPGGRVFIHTGLLKASRRPEELAGVLAHEMAHVVERHSMRQIISTAGLYLIVQAALGDTTGLLAVMADSSRFLLGQKFSRDFEREADDRGWDYLVRARIDPIGMIDFFERLKKEQENNPLENPSMELISTHPTTQERIGRLKSKLKVNHGVNPQIPDSGKISGRSSGGSSRAVVCFALKTRILE